MRATRIKWGYSRRKEIRMPIKLKRIYDDASSDDGVRILVDRLWPRGISKEQAKIDEWMRDIAPSNELRKWAHEDASRWAEFKRKYHKDLRGQAEAVEKIRKLAKRKTVTLLFAAKDIKQNNAVALSEYLKRLS
jgi:uncharacterized protein YeaO (DUF488 family)